MDRAEASAIAHRWHPIAAPLAPESVRTLIERLAPPAGGRVLDLGCGYGEWLLPLLESVPGLEGVGVDLSGPALAEARARAAARRLSRRVRLEQADAGTWSGDRFDAVLCVAASHVFGGLAGTLTALRRHLRPGGTVLLGDGFWESGPTPEALAALGAEPGELPDLAGFMAEVERQGYEPAYGHLSTPAEWDDYEWSWTGALTTWALTEATDPADREEALGIARTHRREWLAGYRGQLGFVTVVLHDVAGS
ncbi:class I SAM-dependent methyltransferase [Blastococcus sp. SYSU D00820]